MLFVSSCETIDGFLMRFPSNSSTRGFMRSILGPTPNHAPRPFVLTVTASVGTFDHVVFAVDVGVQTDELLVDDASFLDELSFGATSSSQSRTVGSAIFRQILDVNTSMGIFPTAWVSADAATSAGSPLVACVDVVTFIDRF